MTGFIANARMYGVTPEVEALWQELLARVAAEAGVPLTYVPYPAPQPLEALWSRPDLGCVLMCGYPIALRLAEVQPIAAPIPAVDWAEGRAVYRSDYIVRRDSPFYSLSDTFGHRAGWTVEHSHSGFNAFRFSLLRYRTVEEPTLYREVRGNLVTARRILDSVLDGSIDVGPLDSYWHLLIAKYRPDLVVGIRVVESSHTAPCPAFVASTALPEREVEALRAAFVGAASKAWFEPHGRALAIERFAAVYHSSFKLTLSRARAALRAGYPFPA